MRRFLSALVLAIAWSALIAYAQTATAIVGVALHRVGGLVDVAMDVDETRDQRLARIAQLRWGVTTLRSAGNDKPETVPLFRQTRDGAFVSPRSYTAGTTGRSGPARQPIWCCSTPIPAPTSGTRSRSPA